MVPSVLAFGMGGEQLLIPLDWDTPIAIDVAAVEPQTEMLPAAAANILDFTGTQFMPCTRIPILSTSSRTPPALPIGLVNAYGCRKRCQKPAPPPSWFVMIG